MILHSNPRLIGEPAIPNKSALLRRLGHFVPRNEPSIVLLDGKGNVHGDAPSEQIRDLRIIHDSVLALLKSRGEVDLPFLPFMYMGEFANPHRHPLCRLHRDEATRFVWVEGAPHFEAIHGDLELEPWEDVHTKTLAALQSGQVKKTHFPKGWVYGVGPEDVHARESISCHGEEAIRHLMSFEPEPSSSFMMFAK